MEQLQASIYDYPAYYDLAFGSDWKAEFDFLQGCFELHARGRVRRLFEPACGTGRLLFRLAGCGYEVAGLDLNPKAVSFCNARLKRLGLPESARVGDMREFQLARRVDAAYNTINSFRHLPSEEAAQNHLQCIARSLRAGGIYVLGLSLTPTSAQPTREETWSIRRGHLGINARIEVLERDLRHRRERAAMCFDIYTPLRQFRLRHEAVFRTYTARQLLRLFGRLPALEIAEVYDFSYDLNDSLEITPALEDVVLVLRKRRA